MSLESVKTIHVYSCGSCGLEVSKEKSGLCEVWYSVHFKAQLSKHKSMPYEDNLYYPTIGYHGKTLICDSCSANFRSLEVNDEKFRKIAREVFDRFLKD